MRILVVGPSPHMKHDPGLIVSDFIKEALSLHEIFGCFFHHDFSKHPIGQEDCLLINDSNIKSKWIDSSKANSAVIDTYDSLMENDIEVIVSFGSIAESEFIRAAKETSGKNIQWVHVITIANHVHDSRFSETLCSIDLILTYSESQKNNLISVCKVGENSIFLIERKFETPILLPAHSTEILCGGWNTESFNLKSVFEAASGLGHSFKCLTNYYEYGDFDLESMESVFFKDQNIYPVAFSSLFEKPEAQEWDSHIDNCKVFVDMSMSQGGCPTLMRAHSAGAKCIIVDTPRHRELARCLGGIELVRSSVFFSTSGIKLYIPDHLCLHMAIIEVFSNTFALEKKSTIIIKNKKIIEKEFYVIFNNIITIGFAEKFLGLESLT